MALGCHACSAVTMQIACAEVRYHIPEPGLLVSAECIGDVPHHIRTHVCEIHLLLIHVLRIVEFGCECGLVLVPSVRTESAVSDTCAHARREPFSDIHFYRRSDPCLVLHGAEPSILEQVDTTADTDKPVVPCTVSLIRTAYDASQRIPVPVFLCTGIACKCN